MSLSSDAIALEQFGKKVSEIQGELTGYAGKVTSGFPTSCDTPAAKRVFEQATRLGTLLRQAAELAGQTGAVAQQEARRIQGG